MLRMLGFCLKFAIFSLAVLILGNWLRWDGKTLSDQIKWRMSHAEESAIFGSVKNWTKQLTTDAKKGLQKKIDHISIEEEIPSSEKQKLKALIRELNSSHKQD